MKKIMLVAAAAVLALSLVGCSKGGASAKGVAQAKFPVQITGNVLPVFAAPPAVLKRCFDQTDTFTVSDAVLKCELQDGSYIISLSKE